MDDDSLTTDNLTDILRAMHKIKHIDRSEYFNKYYNEISKVWIEKQLKAMEPGNQGAMAPNKRIEHDSLINKG